MAARVTTCPFCHLEPEMTEHLFFVLFGSSSPCGLKVPYRSSFCAFPRCIIEMCWVTFFAIIWSIWIFQNKMMFTGKVLDQQEFFESILIRLGRWFRAKWGSTGVSLDYFLRAPQNFRVPNTHKNDTKRVIWTPPPCGAVKFNEDAGVVGSNGTVGIGGILSSLVIFSKSAGLTDPALVEVLAIKEALTIYSACKWSGTHKLIEESDCAVAVCWVRSPGQSRDIIEILREANGTADRLAKAGINRKVNLLSL
ncbi:hypothetical protein ERO13_D06G188501v2 [Gossypium hirsutum]|uniref:RNase H type-1 domain-containing protein n=1 Tax=Gossypium mustelinum TaxID=34275 RepID=A0A5D2ULP9_GOSMU|nr:hypothetical protein ERO13_D06G188501v2 [Gossypium hirsutum]TYI78627.1 hypothetical protein E1A91_D06G225600v1 [Gossypium mustelinum]